MVWYRWQLVMLAVLAASGAVLSGCSDNKKSPTQPVPGPEVPTVVQTFNGNVEQKGRDCKSFSMANPGNVLVKVTKFSPLGTITMGLALGQPDPTEVGNCGVFGEDNSVRASESFGSSSLAAGSYCTCVFDVGNIFSGNTVSYTLQVTHPE